jgi:hypothetical protein
MNVRRALLALTVFSLALAGCGGGLIVKRERAPTRTVVVQSPAPSSGQSLPFPALATKNTTRVGAASPIDNAAAVALATFPSVVPGTHPSAVALASTDDWQAALAASVLMSSPLHAPLLLSDSATTLPPVSAAALKQLAPSGAGSIDGAQLIRIGDVPSVAGYRTASIRGSDPYTLAANIDKFASAAAGRPSPDVVIASGANPTYAMPAAGWAAESGDPLLFVSAGGVPPATRQDLLAHGRPHIYVLGPASVVPGSVLAQLKRYGTVRRIAAGAGDPASNSVAFAEYRDPPCVYQQPCAHIPGSFGWAMRSPGHGYVLIDAAQPLDAAAAAPLSGSGDFGPELLIDNPSKLPSSVLNYFLNYATPGYTSEGPTAAVYNHGWLIGDERQISLGVQAEVDNLLQAVPQR